MEDIQVRGGAQPGAGLMERWTKLATLQRLFDESQRLYGQSGEENLPKPTVWGDWEEDYISREDWMYLYGLGGHLIETKARAIRGQAMREGGGGP